LLRQIFEPGREQLNGQAERLQGTLSRDVGIATVEAHDLYRTPVLVTVWLIGDAHPGDDRYFAA